VPTDFPKGPSTGHFARSSFETKTAGHDAESATTSRYPM
jgi:hypothetical protein